MIAKVLIDNITKNELISEWGLAFYIEFEGKKSKVGFGNTIYEECVFNREKKKSENSVRSDQVSLHEKRRTYRT